MCASAVEKAWPLSLWRRCLHGARRFGEAPSGRRTADGRRGLLLGSGLLPAWWSKIQQGRKGKGSKGQPCLAATEKTQGILAWTKKEKNSIRRLSYCTALRVTAYVYLQFGTAGWPRHLTSGPHHYETMQDTANMHAFQASGRHIDGLWSLASPMLLLCGPRLHHRVSGLAA